MKASVDWEVQEERKPIVRGFTKRKRFLAAFLSGFLMLGILGTVFGVSGVAAAVPLAGVGHFQVNFDKLDGTGFLFFPKLGENGNSDQAPMVRNKIDKATVYGLHIYKDVKLPTGNWIRVNIKASEPVQITGLIQDAKDVKGNFDFKALALSEHNTDDFTKEFTQEAKHLTITDAEIETDYLFQSLVTLNGTHIYVEDISDDR